MLDLVPIDRSVIRRVWGPTYIAAVTEIIRKCDADFIAADVYRELTTESAYLYSITVDGKEEGFTILSLFTDRYSQRRVLSLDMTWMHSDHVPYPALVKALDELATGVGAEKIEWNSPREGWTKVMPQYGYMPSGRCYSREVPQ